MSIVEAGAAGTGLEPSPGKGARYARAIGGEAHRCRVRLPVGTVPESLYLATEGATMATPYRLLRAPRSRRPITDDQGDYIYVPQRQRPELTRPDPT